MSRYTEARSVYDLSFDEVVAATGDAVAAVVYRQLYAERRLKSPEVESLVAATGLTRPSALRRSAVNSGHMTSKYLFDLPSGDAIEAVRIRRRTGMTACVSSQVGCGFGCAFCASGRLGLRRHLLPGEIVQQVMELGQRINRVVFMGIGEPLHNYDNVLKAIRILGDRRGLDMSTAGMTISTIGLPEGLKRLREEHLKINLTISLHATTDELRHDLIPGSKGHEIEEIVARSQSWAVRHNRVPTYVYLVLPGLNDSPADVARLRAWFKGQPARVNLMRWNPVGGGRQFKRVDDRTLGRFKSGLTAAGIPTVVRDTQGKDIEAACGQLWLHNGRSDAGQAVSVLPSRGKRSKRRRSH